MFQQICSRTAGKSCLLLYCSWTGPEGRPVQDFFNTHAIGPRYHVRYRSKGRACGVWGPIRRQRLGALAYRRDMPGHVEDDLYKRTLALPGRCSLRSSPRAKVGDPKLHHIPELARNCPSFDWCTTPIIGALSSSQS